MSRGTRERRLEAESRWPMLCQMLGTHFGQDVFHGPETLPQARDAAILGFDLPDQKQIAMEWWDWNRTVGGTEHVRASLDAYGVELDFKSEAEARVFMSDVYDALIVAIRRHERGWKP